MAPPARAITVALDTSKAFDTTNIHTIIRKLIQTKIPDTITNFNATLHQGTQNPTQYIEIVNSKLAFHKVASFTNIIPHLHCWHTTIQSTGSGHGLRRWHHHHIYTHMHECSQKYIQPYLHTVFLPGLNCSKMINLIEPCIDKHVGHAWQLACNRIYYIYTTPTHVLYKSMFPIK